MVKAVFRWDVSILTVILSLALVVRLLGINYGFPYVFYPDEAVIVNHAIAFGTGDLNPHSFIYPSLYMYVLFFIYGLSYMIGWLVGEFTATSDFVRLFFNDATLFYLPGRLIAALSGVGSVGMVYILGRHAYNVRVGLIAAAFLAFSVLHVGVSHYVKVHVPAGLLVIVGLWLAWSIYDGRDGWRNYLLAGVVAGLGASVSYHAGFVLISVVVAHVLRWKASSNNTAKVRLLSPKLLSAVGASFIGFVLGTPFALLDWQTFVAELSSGGSMMYHGGFWEQGAFYHFTSLPTSMGPPLGVVALLGLSYALLRIRPASLILLSQPLFLAGFLMLFASKDSLHLLIAHPAISILGAVFLVELVSWLVRPPKLQILTLSLAAVLLLIVPARICFQNSYRLTLPDTRILAKDWVEKNIPFDSKIVMDSGKYYLSTFGPPLRLSRWTLEQFIARGESLTRRNLTSRDGTRPVGYFGEAEYFRQQLQAQDNQPGYNIVQILHDVGSFKSEVLTLQEYAAMGVQYVIVSGFAGESRDFYQALETQATLLKEFSPSSSMAGPTLRIYKIQ